MKQLFARSNLYARWGYGLPEVQRHEARLAHLPDALAGATALFVTDVHLGEFAGRDFAVQLAQLMAHAQADMLLLGGDYAETGETMRLFFELLGEMSFPMGMYASTTL